MFNKLRTNTHLKAKADGNGLEVGFYSHVARIARVHQYGLRDRIVAIGGEVIYANRYLLTPEQVESDLITKIFKDVWKKIHKLKLSILDYSFRLREFK